MIYFNKGDVSDGADVNKTSSSKELSFVIICIFR